MKPSLILLFFAACSGPTELVLDAPKTGIADGISAITIHCTAKFRGGAVPDDTKINFTTDIGSFSANEAESTGVADTLVGLTSVQLEAPNQAGVAHIQASFTDPNNETVSATIAVTFTAAPPASAGSIGWSCAAGSISARVSNVDGATTNCTLSLKDPSGTPQPAGSVQFFAEAGRITDAGVVGTLRRATYVASTGDAPPVDVSPLPQEADYTSASAGQTRNPRDMVASLLAVVVAQEAFVDSNGNGVYDANEPFTDEPEPFIDVDDDGVFTAGIDIFLPAFDVNGNGQWDNGNAQWDASTKVGRTTHVLWAGDATLTALNNPVSVGAAPGTESFLLVDDYGNPPAGFGSEDTMSLSLDDTNGLQVSGLVTTPITSVIPMSYSAAGVFVDLAPGRRFDVTITDTRTSPAEAETLTLEAEARFTPTVQSSEKDLTASVAVNIAAK